MSDELKKNFEYKVPKKKEFDPTQDLSLAGKRKLKRGLGAKPLLESEILEVQTKARSASEAARMLGVNYKTYKKYAELYGIFENLLNPTGIGIPKGLTKIGTVYSLDDILEGKYPEYQPWQLKRRLLTNGYMEEKCSVCGFSERRIMDMKVPLVLDYLDDDRTNHRYENLRLLCFNCAYLIRGNLSGPSKEYQY